MGYPGEALSIPQLLFALNTKLSDQICPFDRTIPEAELSVHKCKVQAALVTINRGLNAYRPVTRLPADILLSIPTYFDSNVIQFELVNLTHVYHYWRETFISAPSLWSNIYVGGLPVPLLALSLERSRSAHIRLRIGPYDYNRFTMVVAPIVTTQRNEYDTLWVDSEWDKIVTLSRLTSNAVSHLRALSLSISTREQDESISAHLPFSRAVTLQELTLRLISHDIRSILDCFRFTKLTVLSLFSTASITHSKVLEFLSISPGLRRVVLDFRRLITDEAPCPRVVLRDLRQLRIDVTASGDSHLRLFTNLICPFAEDVVISVQPIYFGSLEASPLQSSWGFFPRSPRVHAIELEVGRSQIETTYSVRLLFGGGSRFEISFRFVSFVARGIRALPIAYDPNEFSLFQALLRSLRALSPSGVTRLSITGIDPSAIPPSKKYEVSSSIRELLVDVDNLETLTVSSGCLPAVCQALTPRLIPPVVLCPKLNSVELLLPTSSRHQQHFGAELVTMCKARAAAGYAVQNLTSTLPQDSETSIDQLDREFYGM